ncbi:GNAT family N-acetyltransferase [Saccharospirillum salsuginis]|uniref:N-acetyltransferase domain-containing protein n=1 Tax=Saccharospirillum salsuginis TaxID=418750 RepID=A0A918NF55_9GAMM|nr:GNAT family N-acetyltransferase [Saccharospirillum salsuginis]GGX62648.1 hypothetical protein GCM10007392_33190 [Saccharospirillum salsuginis]
MVDRKEIEVRVRRAVQADKDTLSTLCITVWVDTYCIDGVEPNLADYVLSAYSPTRLAQTIEEKHVFVAEHAGGVIGLAVFDSDTGEIETLYVLPRFQGKRAGCLLLSAIQSGYKGPVFLTCWEKNVPAIQFYKQNGFIETGEAFFELDGQVHRNIELSVL